MTGINVGEQGTHWSGALGGRPRLVSTGEVQGGLPDVTASVGEALAHRAWGAGKEGKGYAGKGK